MAWYRLKVHEIVETRNKGYSIKLLCMSRTSSFVFLLEEHKKGFQVIYCSWHLGMGEYWLKVHEIVETGNKGYLIKLLYISGKSTVEESAIYFQTVCKKIICRRCIVHSNCKIWTHLLVMCTENRDSIHSERGVLYSISAKY